MPTEPASDAERATEIKARLKAYATSLAGSPARFEFQARAFEDVVWLLADRAAMAKRVEELEAQLHIDERAADRRYGTSEDYLISNNITAIVLPEPPSANRWWRNVNGRMVTSKEARVYKASVARTLPHPLLRGPVSVEIVWYRGRKSGDLDKRLGVVLDALQGVLYENDSQIVELTARRFDDPKHARIVVRVTPLGAAQDTHGLER